jgi:phosphate:Na+ symporter
VNKIVSLKFNMLLISILGVGLILTGCGKTSDKGIVDRIKIIQGNNQCALPNQEYSKEIRLELQGVNQPGLLGGKGTRGPVANAIILLEPLEGSDLILASKELKSDSGGGVHFKVKSGKTIGDHYLKIIPVGYEKKSVTLRFINGISITGNRQQTAAGSMLENPIKVTVVDAAGKPVEGAPVYFSIGSTPERKIKTSIKKPTVYTNKDGIAETNVKLGNKTGSYKINVEVADSEHDIHVRGISVTELGLNTTELIITVLGGLALFVFGMSLMSSGLQMVAGENMRKILQFFAKNRFVAASAGMMVTAVIQSSSACTVMVIGFVNAGLINLTQAIGIVFGANIGTTITAQMISFKLTKLAFPAIVIGLLLVIIKKNNVIKGWGETVLGFGLLFLGMTTMSSELKLIGTFPTFIKVFQTFDCSPVDGTMPVMAICGAIFIGAAVTVLVQSSSASMGIVLALAGTGLIDFYTAVPLILGTNIGTTVTAALASIAANRVAKQAAMAHFLFNVIGAGLMIWLFFIPYGDTGIPVFMYFVNDITQGDVFASVPQNMVRHIAMAHTFFNIFNVLLLIPFVGIIAKLCQMIIPIPADEKVKIEHLEPHLLATPSIALEQAIHSIRYMVKESWKMVDMAVNQHFLPINTDIKGFQDLEKREDLMDELQSDITNYLVQLTQREITESQAQLVPLLMHCTNDAERIADHTENILALTERLKKTKKDISEKGHKELDAMWLVLKDQAENVIAALDGTERDNITFALSDEKCINKMADDFERAHVKRLSKGNCDPVTGIIFIEMLSELERIGDHLSNIAERAPEIQKHYVELT